MEKRKQHTERIRVAKKANEPSIHPSSTASPEAIDHLLAKLRNGDVVRKGRRGRANLQQPSAELHDDAIRGDPSDRAKDMLAKLKAEGIETSRLSPVSPSSLSTRFTTRRARLRISDLASETSPVEEENGEADFEPDTTFSSDWRTNDNFFDFTNTEYNTFLDNESVIPAETSTRLDVSEKLSISEMQTG